MITFIRTVAITHGLAAVLAVAFAGPSFSADPMDAFKKAARAVKIEKAEGAQDLEAYDMAREKAVEAWKSVPFLIRKIALTEEKATGSGMYKERGTSAYTTGDTIYVYLEPVGYAWEDAGRGLYAFGFVADLKIKAENGAIALDKNALIDGDFKSHTKNMEAYMNASIDIETLPDGSYTLEFVIHDKHSNAITTVTQDFSFKNKKAP